MSCQARAVSIGLEEYINGEVVK
ncbi:hypothetical protein CCACVL1_22935, partial [Corchorus capsularis]